MDHLAPPLQATVRPWRTATLVVSAIAVAELVVLIALGVASLGVGGNSTASTSRTAKARAARHPAAPRVPRAKPVGPPRLARRSTSVLVLNGNGRDGAAAAEAASVRARGYRIVGVGNARRANFPRSFVMYRPEFQAEALRLARDLGIRSVTPVDGMRPAELHGAHAVVVVGR